MRYFVAFMMTILLIIILIMLLFRGGGKQKAPVISKPLVSYATTDAQVRLTIDGPVNADLVHEQIRITVDRDDVTFEHVKGYEGNVVAQQQYANNTEAYTTFLLALQHSGYTHGDTAAQLKDERGFCPLGERFVAEILQDGKTLQHFWSTSCGAPKTYLGDISTVRALFQAQVPDYLQQSQGIPL